MMEKTQESPDGGENDRDKDQARVILGLCYESLQTYR